MTIPYKATTAPHINVLTRAPNRLIHGLSA